MSSPPHIVGVVGSLREESYTRIAIKYALAESREFGATTTLADLREYDLPVFNPDNRTVGDVEQLKGELQAADSVILGTPLYHSSYSSALKNALDYCGFDEFTDTTVGLLTVAGGGFPTPALEHLRAVCRSVNAWVLPHQVAIPQAKHKIDEGEFIDDELAKRVETLGQRVVEYSNIEPDPPSFRSAQNKGADD